MMNLLHCQPCARDCRNRSAVCRLSCEKWREYESITRPSLYAAQSKRRAGIYVSPNAARIVRRMLLDRKRNR